MLIQPSIQRTHQPTNQLSAGAKMLGLSSPQILHHQIWRRILKSLNNPIPTKYDINYCNEYYTRLPPFSNIMASNIAKSITQDFFFSDIKPSYLVTYTATYPYTAKGKCVLSFIPGKYLRYTLTRECIWKVYLYNDEKIGLIVMGLPLKYPQDLPNILQKSPQISLK